MGNIRKIAKSKRKYYNSIGKVFSPALEADVHFTSDGFYHLLYKNRKRPRKVSSKYMRLMCIQHAPGVVRECKEVTEIRRGRKRYKGKMKGIVSYELVHKRKSGKKYKIVVQKVGLYSNYYKFASIMPLHKTRRRRKIKRSAKKRS